MWVYIKSEPALYTVGFYAPDGKWHSDSDHSNSDSAAARVNYLNGGADCNLDSGSWDEYKRKKNGVTP